MSEEQLKAFIAKVQADTSLQEQLKAEGADPVAIAKAAGFSTTTEDLKTASQTHQAVPVQSSLINDGPAKGSKPTVPTTVVDAVTSSGV